MVPVRELVVGVQGCIATIIVVVVVVGNEIVSHRVRAAPRSIRTKKKNRHGLLKSSPQLT